MDSSAHHRCQPPSAVVPVEEEVIGDLKVALPESTFAIAFVLQDLPPVDEGSNEMTFGPAASLRRAVSF
jgi:hypothetical protein